MKIDSFQSMLKGLEPLQPAQKPQVQSPVGGNQSNFGQVFADALSEVDQMQKSAQDHVEGITIGKDGYTTHGAMIALEKADIAFQLMSQIKSKIVMAYQEVMRTQV